AILILILTYNFKTEKVFAVKIDWFGSLISMCCLLSAVLSIVKVKDWGISDWKTVVCVLSAFMTGVGFIHIEKRSSYPMIDLRLFSIKVFTTSTALAFIVQFFYIGVIVILPIFLTNVQGKTEFMAALMLLPMSITVFIFGGMGSLLINKLGPRLLVFIGLTFILFSYSLLTYINPKNNL
ncbi:MFS transporter, partial [Streptococcus agalactiae]|nr:MFS transporter [Streptococcus agalactiae]